MFPWGSRDVRRDTSSRTEQRRYEGPNKNVFSSTNERADLGTSPDQYSDMRLAEKGHLKQEKMTNLQASTIQVLEEKCKVKEMKIPSKEQNYEKDHRVVRELSSVHGSTEMSISKGTPTTDIKVRFQEEGILEQKLDSPAEEELDEAASLVSESRSISPFAASEQAASSSSYKSMEVIKMKLEFRQKQFEFKEKLAHERAMRETELKWHLDYNRVLEKLQEKEAELQRQRREKLCIFHNRETASPPSILRGATEEPEERGPRDQCLYYSPQSLGRNMREEHPEGSAPSRHPLLFDGTTEKKTPEKNPGERSDQPAKKKIHNLIIELKSLEEDENPETLAFVDIVTDHVRLHKKMIRSPKVSQKADLPKETRTASLVPPPEAEEKPKQPEEDKKQGSEIDTKPLTSLPDALPVAPSCIPPKTSTSLIIIFPIQVLVVGQAFGSDQQFLNQVEKHLERSEIYLQKEPFTPSSDVLVLLFCPVVSRAGTDIGNALERSSAQAKIILVVMNHVPNESMTVYLDSRSKVHRRSVIHSVDCRFSERSGLYTSQMNNDAVISVVHKIQEEAKAKI